MNQVDCVKDIKAAVGGMGFDLTRAEERVGFDSALRAEINKIPERSLRQHAAEILRVWRAARFAESMRTDACVTERQIEAALNAAYVVAGLFDPPHDYEESWQ